MTKKIILLSLFLNFVFCSIFSGTMNPKVRQVPKDTTELVFKKPKEWLPSVVKNLTQNVSGAQAKSRVIHDWICDNISYDTGMYFSGRVSKQDYESVLKCKKAVCSGYTNLMNEMCRLAGIESIGISGYSKGFGYRGKLGNQPDHAWNAINVNGKWKLIYFGSFGIALEDRERLFQLEQDDNYEDEYIFPLSYDKVSYFLTPSKISVSSTLIEKNKSSDFYDVSNLIDNSWKTWVEGKNNDGIGEN